MEQARAHALQRSVDDSVRTRPQAQGSTCAASPVPALAVAGIIGANLMIEGYQLGQRPGDGAARGLVILLVTVLSVAFGAFIAHGYTRERAPADPWAIPPRDAPPPPPPTPGLLETALRTLVGGAVAAVVVALTLWLLVWQLAFEHVLASAAVGTALWAPVLLTVVHLHYRARRSRVGSLVRACDERAVWFALAVVALLGCAALHFVPVNAGLRARALDPAIGMLALLLMPWFAGRNGIALVRTWRLARATQRLHRTGEVPPELEVLDLGVGREVYEEREGGSAYRRGPATRVVFGSPGQTLQIVRWNAVTLAVLTAAGVGMFTNFGLS